MREAQSGAIQEARRRVAPRRQQQRQTAAARHWETTDCANPEDEDEGESEPLWLWLPLCANDDRTILAGCHVDATSTVMLLLDLDSIAPIRASLVAVSRVLRLRFDAIFDDRSFAKTLFEIAIRCIRMLSSPPAAPISSPTRPISGRRLGSVRRRRAKRRATAKGLAVVRFSSESPTQLQMQLWHLLVQESNAAGAAAAAGAANVIAGLVLHENALKPALPVDLIRIRIHLELLAIPL